MFTAQGAQLPLRTKSAAKVLLFFDICKKNRPIRAIFLETLSHILHR